ncbi:MAG: type IV pilus modification PilV family protein [Rhodoglobus sp.]
MTSIHRRLAALRGQEGMTLIEVIVAMTLMAFVAIAAVSLSITSSTAAATQQRQEVAVTVASQAMEIATSRNSKFITGTTVSNLYFGRTQAAVDIQWADNPLALGMASTKKNWDPAPLGHAVVVPYQFEQTLAGTKYTAHILIGDCFQKKTTGGLASDCGLLPVGATPTDYTTLVRIMVLVRWTAGSGCATSGCTYQTTALMDPHTDLTWNS